MKRNYWTLERFKRETNIIHANKYTYDSVIDINSHKQQILVHCVYCNKDWFTTPNRHLTRKHGCPYFRCKSKWSLSYFLERAKICRGDQYDYSLVTKEEIKNCESLIMITCKVCEISSTISIYQHLAAIVKRLHSRNFYNVLWIFMEKDMIILKLLL